MIFLITYVQKKNLTHYVTNQTMVTRGYVTHRGYPALRRRVHKRPRRHHQKATNRRVEIAAKKKAQKAKVALSTKTKQLEKVADNASAQAKNLEKVADNLAKRAKSGKATAAAVTQVDTQTKKTVTAAKKVQSTAKKVQTTTKEQRQRKKQASGRNPMGKPPPKKKTPTKKKVTTIKKRKVSDVRARGRRMAKSRKLNNPDVDERLARYKARELGQPYRPAKKTSTKKKASGVGKKTYIRKKTIARYPGTYSDGCAYGRFTTGKKTCRPKRLTCRKGLVRTKDGKCPAYITLQQLRALARKFNALVKAGKVDPVMMGAKAIKDYKTKTRSQLMASLRYRLKHQTDLPKITVDGRALSNF